MGFTPGLGTFRRRGTAGFIALLAALPALAEQPEDPLAGFDAYAKAALADWRTPGMAIAILREGKVLLARGYGVRRIGTQDAVDEQTVFPIASVTKVFTATCLARLVDEGKLAWSDPVVKHWPEFKLSDTYLTENVRIADLLSHRTGLETADLLAYRGDHDRVEILRRLRYLQPVEPFRSRYVYNNLMYVAAGDLLERVARESWSTFLGTHLLGELGMTRTLASPRELEELANVSTPHILEEGRLVLDPAWSRAEGSDGFRRLHETVAPAGGIQSTVVDMAKFLELHLGDGTVAGRRVLQLKTVREMQASHSLVPIDAEPRSDFAYPRIFFGAGLGWWLRDYRGRKVVYHGGSTGAVAAMMPEEKIGIVVLANRNCGLPYMVMHDTFDRLLGIPRTWTNQDWLLEAEEKPRRDTEAKNSLLEAKRVKEAAPSLPLEEYAGVYACDLYGELELTAEGGTLQLRFGPNIAARLHHWERDTFRGKLSFPHDDEWLVRFVLVEGEPQRLDVERLFWHEPMPSFRRVRERKLPGSHR